MRMKFIIWTRGGVDGAVAGEPSIGHGDPGLSAYPYADPPQFGSCDRSHAVRPHSSTKAQHVVRTRYRIDIYGKTCFLIDSRPTDPDA